jgi:uncharacterized protein (TIGR03437 family)
VKNARRPVRPSQPVAPSITVVNVRRSTCANPDGTLASHTEVTADGTQHDDSPVPGSGAGLNSLLAYIGPPGLISGLTFRPARAGDILTIYGIGFGQTGSGPVPGDIPSSADSVPSGYSVTIGGTTASASYGGVTPTIAGLYQVNVTIPAGIAPGNQPIILNVNGASTPAGAFLAIGP